MRLKVERMSHRSAAATQHVPLPQRVPGVMCSLGIASACLALAAWLAWMHPLVVLNCWPRGVQPPPASGLQRTIMDGTVSRRLWGLFTVGHENLSNVSQFSVHTESATTGDGAGTIRAVTHDRVVEIFDDSLPDTLRCVVQLNSHLDASSPPPLTMLRTRWPSFAMSWTFLLLGSLVLVRNVILAPSRRRRLLHAKHRR